MDKKISEKIGKFWDQPNKSSLNNKIIRLARGLLRERKLPVRGWLTSVIRSSSRKSGWWNNPYIVAKINQLVCGQPIEGRNQGLICLLKDRYYDLLPVARGISVGCGNGLNEINLIKNGIVECFDLFELSQNRINEGVKLAEQVGLSDRVNFKKGDAFELVNDNFSYDMVVWCDSLHHMPDVDQALLWSRHILRKGGIFYLSDYVGPNRLQWTQKTLDMARSVRKGLNRKYIVERNQPFSYPSFEISPPDIEDLVEKDPSEAWDSARIIPSIEKYFPEVQIIPVGGVVYFAALNSCIQNFDPVKDKDILEYLMLKEKKFIEDGETLYAAALGCKDEALKE